MNVDTLLVLVPDAIGGKLDGTEAAREVFLAFLGMLLQPVFLKTIEVSRRLVLASAVLMHAVKPAAFFLVLEVDLRSWTESSLAGQGLIFVVFAKVTGGRNTFLNIK